MKFAAGGLSKAAKFMKFAGKSFDKSAKTISEMIESAKDLSAAERRALAEMAAKEGEELVRLRPQEVAPTAAKKSKGPSPKPARAKPKTREEIEKIAERIAPQLTGEFVRGEKGTTSVAGKSRKQFDIERELEHDMQRSREVPEVREIDLEPHRDSVMLSLPGDISISDYDIFGIGGEGLRAPSRQYGGPRFGLGHPEEAGWASGLIPAAGFQRRVSSASEQYGGVPVLANFLAMGPEGLNYATHFTDALMKLTKPERMTERNIDDFNRIIRSGNQKGEFPDFPGIEHPEATYLYLAENPEARKHFNSVMQLTKTTEALGLPSGLNVRHAVSEPELRDLERGMTGFSLMQMRPEVTGLKPSKHPTYSHDIPGEFLGRTDVLYPYEMTFPDTVAAIRANPKQAGSEFGTLQMLGGKQIIDNQLLDELARYRERIKQLTGKKEGGIVHMANGGEPGEVSGQMFSPKPLEIPSSLSDMIQAIRSQFAKEKRSLRKPGAVQDIALRGPVAMAMGAPADIAELGAQAVDYAQTKIPGLRKPASVMDTGPLKQPTMGYAPKFPLSPEGEMPYGTEAAQKLMGRAGLTTGEERPIMEIGSALASPFATAAAIKGGKIAAPTIAEQLADITGKYGVDPRMYAVPPSEGGKIKAPANEIGFYNPAEKAALNLQRKKGPGNAFISDLKKQPGVTDERLEELGLLDLASNPNLTKEEVIAAAERNRIPLRETVRKEEANPELMEQLESQQRYLSRSIQEVEKDLASAKQKNQPALVNQYQQKLEDLRNSLSKVDQKIMQNKPAQFGPNEAPEYNLPGGTNYREIRVGLPERESSANNFRNQIHHGDEPNVLFHLRVADHTDADGKKGLLVDELQSDWHQAGRDKGYAKAETARIKGQVSQEPDGSWRVNWEDGSFSGGYNEESARRVAAEGKSNAKAGVPDAPFKENWYQLGLKRAIKEAADSGAERLYLTTGARQAERYDLSKQIDDMKVYQNDDGTFNISIKEKGADRFRAFKDGISAEDMPESVGKDMSKKILEDAKNNKSEAGFLKTYSGLDLQVGGEGMKQYYDKTYKNFLDKYAKQFGGRVGQTYLPSAGRGMQDLTSKEINEITSMPGFLQEMMALSGGKTAFQMSDDQYIRVFNQALRKFRPDLGEKVYYIDITPKMRESAKKGQSYKTGGAVTR